MIHGISRDDVRGRIHRRIRRRVRGTAERPRLAVFRSLKHIYAQLIDDVEGRTLAAASSAEKSPATGSGGNVAGAREIGKAIAERAKEKGIRKVVFDRGGYLYHGRVKALADAAREAGLEF
jgi:large subunit ribosomal protein L18